MLCLSFRKWKLVAPFLELCLCYVFNFFIISSNHHHWATSIKQPNNKANQMILVQLFGFPCRWSHLPRQQINNKHSSAMCFSLTRTCCVIHLPITLINHPISIPMPSLQFGKLVLPRIRIGCIYVSSNQFCTLTLCLSVGFSQTKCHHHHHHHDCHI